MPFVPAICTQCGSPIEVDNAKEAGICPHCGTAFITEKAINNYVTQHVSNTTVTQTITKVIHGREKTEAAEYVTRGLSYIGIGEYLEAAKCFQSAVNCEPGNIENHIQLYRALTLDFRLYYGGLTDPERQDAYLKFALSESANSKKLSLHKVFDHIDKLARQQDISALQKQYGYSFRKDKNFWWESYRSATRLYTAEVDGKPDEISALLKKKFGFTDSYNKHLQYFKAAAAYAIENLYDCPDFTEEERTAFFAEYRGDFLDMCWRENYAEERMKASFLGKESVPSPTPTQGVLYLLSYKIFPCRDGVYDLTVHDGPVILAEDVWKREEPPLPDLRLKFENVRPNTAQTFYTHICAKNCRIAGSGTFEFDAANVDIACERLEFEEGVTEIVNSSKKYTSAFTIFEKVVFPDSVTRIGSNVFKLCKKDKLHDKAKGSIRFGKNLKRIEEKAFHGDEFFFKDDLIFPEGTEYIGTNAFDELSLSCRTVVLPASLREVGKSPFGHFAEILCLCDIKNWNTDWYTYRENDYTYTYSFFDVPNNTYYHRYSIKDEEFAEERKRLAQRFKKYADFDENKTVFKPVNEKPAQQKKEGCYIATAVYGSYDCPQVWTLRRYRDFSLSRSAPGRLFVKLYYAISPKLIKLFGKQKWFCAVWKRILDKKVRRLNENGFENTPYND